MVATNLEVHNLMTVDDFMSFKNNDFKHLQQDFKHLQQDVASLCIIMMKFLV